MRITRDMVIAGVPAFELLAFFQQFDGRSWKPETVAAHVGWDIAQGHRLAKSLVDEGFAELSREVGLQDQGYYQATIKGAALALANASQPLKRRTAERLVQEALLRADRINQDPEYVFWITKISAFGSIIGDAPSLGDIDLVVELTPRLDDREQHREAMRRYGVEAERKGRRFGTVLDLLFWAENEIHRIIKNKSGYLSIHTPRDDILKMVESRSLYEFSPAPPTGG